MKHRWVILIALVLATAVGFGIWRWNEKQAHDRMLTAVDLGGHSELGVYGSARWTDLLLKYTTDMRSCCLPRARNSDKTGCRRHHGLGKAFQSPNWPKGCKFGLIRKASGKLAIHLCAETIAMRGSSWTAGTLNCHLKSESIIWGIGMNRAG